MIPRATRPRRRDGDGSLLVVPGKVNVSDAAPLPAFRLALPPGGALSLRAAWSAAHGVATEVDARSGAAWVVFLALAGAHEEAGLPTVDEWAPASLLSLYDQDSAVGVVLGYPDLPGLRSGAGLAPCEVELDRDGALTVTPPHPATHDER